MSQMINEITDAACKHFRIEREQFVSEKHDRTKLSLARKVVFYLLDELGYEPKQVFEHFEFSRQRHHYILTSAKELNRQDNHIFKFNLNSIKRLCSIK